MTMPNRRYLALALLIVLAGAGPAFCQVKAGGPNGPQSGPLKLFLLYPNYRGYLFDDWSQSVNVDVSVTPPSGYSLGQLQVRLSLLDSANASTGGLNAAIANSAVPNPAATPAFAPPAESVTASAMAVDPAASNAISAASGPAPIASLRSTPTAAPSSFFPSGGSDSGLRNDPGLRTTPVRDSGIPSSGFFNKGERTPDTPDPGPGVPSAPD